MKWCRYPRWNRWQLVAKDVCAQPTWEGAQAPVVHVLISYILLLVSHEHSLSHFTAVVQCKQSCDLYKEKYLQVPIFFSFRKSNPEPKLKR